MLTEIYCRFTINRSWSIRSSFITGSNETPESKVNAVFLVAFFLDCGNNCYYLVRNYQINYTDNSRWKANRSTASSKAAHNVWSPNVHYLVRNSLSLVPILQINAVHAPPPFHFPKTRFNIILPSTPKYSKWSVSLTSPNRKLEFKCHTSHVRPSHFIELLKTADISPCFLVTHDWFTLNRFHSTCSSAIQLAFWICLKTFLQ